MLLRNYRSRAVTKPPGLMADHSSSPPPPPPPYQNHNYGGKRSNMIPNSLFGTLPTKLRDFNNNKPLLLYSTESSLRSPTSILDTPLFSHHNTNKNKVDSKSVVIGLALVGDKNSCGHHNNNVLFGTQLRTTTTTTNKEEEEDDAVKGGGDVLSLSEMEACEEYTRVTCHRGPNPRTTHIFNNCIIEGYFMNSLLPQKKKLPSNSSGDFLSFCYTCKDNLDHTKDIFIYKGEKAFCSPECRQREMVLDGAEFD